MSIAARGLWKRFGDTAAVAGVSLEVPEGEMLVLLGPSGCGKTTIMRCIAGLEAPESGSISISGETMFDAAASINVPTHLRRIGMVFQSYAIWPHMSVFENVAFPLEMADRDGLEIETRVREALELVGLEAQAARGASQLSGGQMQRVALARSLVMRPRVLLFDEPLSNLDARLRDRLRIQLRELQSQMNITSIYVTHDQTEALALADRIAVMETGKVLQEGDPISVYNEPQTSRIAEFLGYTNVFPVRSVERGEGRWKVRLDDDISLETSPARQNDGDLCLCVRPQDIVLGLATGDAAGIDAEITLASFMGVCMHYRVRVGSGRSWDVLAMEINPSLRRGAKVKLSVPPSRAMLVRSA